jgi:protein-S-isoprenylcysteine O-methyltransferase Ste14
MYLGGIILYSGLILLSSSNILLTLVMFIIFINFSIDRLDREEFLMIEKFPEEYINYMKKTKALIPFVF